MLGVSPPDCLRAEYNAWKDMGWLGHDRIYELILIFIKLSGL